ncbi:MAG: glycosyltransferase family 2 protein [Gemmatimonadetes bacterium]|nr:glycosyltransferase family 2 protein [Gemmatimonadota bacterium]
MSAPLFSIVIPTYNRCELVRHAVESVLRQTFQDFEVVVSDNCSEDDTPAVVAAIADSRVRYVRTPRHGAIADSWDFARSQARGTLVMMLSDDDALVATALARFADAHHRFGADFLFSNQAEYRDATFHGPDRNTVSWQAFSGTTRLVGRDEFVAPLFAFRPRFATHPSAFVFARSVAETVASRCGHFFRANGVEFFAWPLAAVFSERIAFIDAPLVIVGRTSKSWGSNLVLSNPGQETIQRMIADVDHDRDWVPLTNFTLCNLMAEGLLLAKQLFPEELRPYEFAEEQYLRKTARELLRREAMGVNVARELDELLAYVEKYPSLRDEVRALVAARRRAGPTSFQRLARALRWGRAQRRLRALLGSGKRNGNGKARRRFVVSGAEQGFDDVLGCAAFLATVAASTPPAREAVGAA